MRVYVLQPVIGDDRSSFILMDFSYDLDCASKQRHLCFMVDTAFLRQKIYGVLIFRMEQIYSSMMQYSVTVKRKVEKIR